MSRDVTPSTNSLSENLVHDIKNLIDESRKQVAVSVNTALTTLYWQIGNRINNEILNNKRADYGKKILPTLSAKLILHYGRGWSERNLAYMIRFAEVFPNPEYLQTLCAKLSWSHFKALIYMDDPLKRNFYAEICGLEGWSTRVLKKRIDSMLYERTAVSKKPENLIRQELDNLRQENLISPNMVLKTPYILDFLELNDRYLEKDLEDAILREMEQFLLELGAGFSFVARQKRLQIDDEDFYIDLLFFNRKLKRLIAIDLKQGIFKPEYKGQMELYLRWLDRYERQEGEASPLGIILCTGKKEEQIELLGLDQSGIHVAEYLTILPAKEILQKKLQEAISKSHLRHKNKGND